MKRWQLVAAALLTVVEIAVAQSSFPMVKIKSVIQPDRGYVVQEIVVDGKKFEPNQLAEAGQAALLSSGWKMANAKKREKLALDWCTQVVLAGRTPLVDAPPDFKQEKHPFQAPGAKTEADGNIHVRIWLHDGGSMRGPANRYYRSHWSFSPAGQIKSLKPVEEWTPS